MLTIDQIKLIGIPKNTSRLNNRLLTPAALPNDSVNLYQAVKLIIEDLNIGSSSTDLSIDIAATTISLNSSTGMGTVLPSATYTDAGLMSAADKSSLDALVTLTGMGAGSLHLGQFTGAIISNNLTIKAALQQLETAIENVILPSGNDLSTSYTLNDITILSATGADALVGAATASNAGVMTASDKIKLDAVDTNMNNIYTLIGYPSPGATSLGTFSGSIIPNNTTVAIALQSLETAIELFGAADGNGIYSGSGTVPAATTVSLDGNLSIDTATTVGKSIWLGNVSGIGNSRAGMIITHDATFTGIVHGITSNYVLSNGLGTYMYADSGNYGIELFSGGQTDVRFGSNSGMTFSRISGTGTLKYAEDYSANYTARSLVDKGYVDAVTGVTTDITITQSNNTVTVNSSSGNDGTIVSATSSTAGVLTAGDKRKLDALVALTGVPTESISLGTFTGTIIADSRDIKTALQDVETYLMNLKSGGEYAYTNGPSYTLTGTTRTVYAEATGSNINISAGSQLTEGEIYYLYTRRDLSFGITITPAATYSLFVVDGNIGAETITIPYTVPHGSGQNISFMLQRRGNIIFLTRLA